MKFASVILDIPTAALETPYTYAVPETAEEQAQLAAAKSSAKMPAKKAMQASFDDLLAENPMQTSPIHLATAGLMQTGHAAEASGFDVEILPAANVSRGLSEEKASEPRVASLCSSVQVVCAILGGSLSCAVFFLHTPVHATWGRTAHGAHQRHLAGDAAYGFRGR